MFKKLTLLATALAAVKAFTVPAAANAAQAFTQPAGTLVPVGTTILATSHNWVMPTELGNLSCPTVETSAIITENSGSTVGVGSGVGTASGSCVVVVEGETFPVETTNITLTELMSTAGGVADVAFSVDVDLPGGLVCTFRTPRTATGDIVTYANGDDTLTFTNQPLEGGACGPAEFSGDFTLTAGGSPVILDS